jgi:hypothetical protein
VTEEQGTVVAQGLIERQNTSHRGNLARFPFELRIAGEISSIEDDAGVGRIPIVAVTFAGGLLRLEGAIPGRLTVWSPDGFGQLVVATEPVEVRRQFRWRPA